MLNGFDIGKVERLMLIAWVLKGGMARDAKHLRVGALQQSFGQSPA
jgi:hypothetical protein